MKQLDLLILKVKKLLFIIFSTYAFLSLITRFVLFRKRIIAANGIPFSMYGVKKWMQ